MGTQQQSSRHVRVLHSSLGHPKHIGLTATERGTWLVCLVLADIAHPEPIHESAVRLHVDDAEFDQLYERELIHAEAEQGWFRVHDLRQFHVAPSETPEAAAERQRRSRAARKRQSVTGVTDVTGVTIVTRDETIRDDTNETSSRDSESSSRGDSANPGRDAGGPKHVRGFKRPIEATP